MAVFELFLFCEPVVLQLIVLLIRGVILFEYLNQLHKFKSL